MPNISEKNLFSPSDGGAIACSDEGAKIRFSVYYECQKSPKKIFFHLPTGGAIACSDGGYRPLLPFPGTISG